MQKTLTWATSRKERVASREAEYRLRRYDELDYDHKTSREQRFIEEVVQSELTTLRVVDMTLATI